MTKWLEFASGLKKDFKGAKKTAERQGAADFLEWAEKVGLEFPRMDISKTLAEYEESLDAYRNVKGQLNKKGQTAVKMAKLLLEKAQQVGPEELDDLASDPQEEPTDPDPTPPTNEAPEDEMPRRDDEELEQDELQDELDEEQQLEAEEEEEAEPARRPKKRPAPRIVVQMPPQRRPGLPRAEPRGSAVRNILPRTERIRLYKRDDYGKRQHIDDYSVDEIGDVKLETFLREYIDESFGNQSGVTEYIAYELDARTGREKQPPSTITIESEVPQEAPDGFGAVRKAMGLINELQQVAQPNQQQPGNDLIRRAQTNAAEKGDMQSMMMLMMMERFMGGGSSSGSKTEELLLKVLDRMEKSERRSSSGDFGPPPPFSGGFGGFPPPPPMYMPPPPMAQANSIDKVVELAVAKLVQPSPPISEQVREMLTIKQLAGGGGDSSEVAALRTELAALRAQVQTPKVAGGIEDSLANFEKFTTIVKSVAPQVTGGDGPAGFLKGIFTSDVGKVLGDVIAKAATQQAGQQQGQQPQQPQQPQQTQQTAPQKPAGPPPPPPQVVDAVKAFHIAQTTEVQVQRFVDVMLAMYTSGVEHYRRILDPALEALNKADQSVEFLNVPRRTAMSLIMEMRPPLATPDFVDKCIAAMAMRAGVEKLPDTLLKTAGKWTADYAGNILLLEQLGAKPVVEEKPKEEPSNGSHAAQVSAQPPLPLTDVVEKESPAPVPSPPHIEVVEFPVKA